MLKTHCQIAFQKSCPNLQYSTSFSIPTKAVDINIVNILNNLVNLYDFHAYDDRVRLVFHVTYFLVNNYWSFFVNKLII